MPVQLTPLGMERPLADSTKPTNEPDMKANRRIEFQSRPPARPPVGPKIWTRRVVTTPPPSLKTNYPEAVKEGIRQGIIWKPRQL